MFFIHIEVVCDVVHRSNKIHVATVHRYVTFIKFQSKAHNIILEPIREPIKQVHHVEFMVTNEDVNVIINLLLE